MQKLHNAIKGLVTHRKELSGMTGGVAKSAAILSTCEEHAGLSRALSQLADVEEKVELLRSEQANSDLYILSEILKDYLGLFGAIKDVFHERVKVTSAAHINHLLDVEVNTNPLSIARFFKIGSILSYS